MFGICFIYITGLLIVSISYLLEPIQAWLYRRHNLKEDAYLEWIADETLQLQRMAYQGLKSGHWSRYTDQIPLTEAGEILANLPRNYPLEKKRKPDVEQASSVEKSTGMTAVIRQVSTPTQVETDAGSTTSHDDRSCVDTTSLGGRQSMEVLSAGMMPSYNSFQPSTVPHVDANRQSPPEPAPLELGKLTQQGSAEYNTTTPGHDQGPARVSSCSSVADRSGNTCSN